jgi:hypothetical protein
MSFEDRKRTILLREAGTDVKEHLFQGKVPQGIWFSESNASSH